VSVFDPASAASASQRSLCALAPRREKSKEYKKLAGVVLEVIVHVSRSTCHKCKFRLRGGGGRFSSLGSKTPRVCALLLLSRFALTSDTRALKATAIVFANAN